MGKIQDRHQELQKKAQRFITPPDVIQIRVGSATCENASGASKVAEEFRKNIALYGENNIKLITVGCTGRCSCEPIVSVSKPGEKTVVYQKVNREIAYRIFTSHIKKNQFVEEALLGDIKLYVNNKTPITYSQKQETLAKFPITEKFFNLFGGIPFYSQQTRIALRNAGLINPENFYDYVSRQGFFGLSIVLDKTDPDWVIDQIMIAKLRGRGGGGFTTAKKWQLAKTHEEKIRYLICNADEGDPGAFMDRSLLESDPFGVIEGMIIGGYAIGAQKGFFYIRAEYPLAVERIQTAIDICRQQGLLGKDIWGSSFNFDLEIRLGAGAFVCGEETALIHSIEGEKGQPRTRPPYPTEKGLWNKPTVINNVETLANIPAIIVMGADNFAGIGTKNSGGTKVFALAGKVTHTGLVEVPIGITLREIVSDIGGGVSNGKKVKAIQTGGPAGGLIPESMLDITIDYDTLVAAGSIMGSGGMIVLDEDDCAIDVAKFFITFTQNESCGKCSPCREGTLRMLEILERITGGNGTIEDVDRLERLANLVGKASLCSLGKAAPNPILSTLKHFRHEYLAHVVDKKCPAKKCTALISYEIDQQKCVGCTACARVCPVECITGEQKQAHSIDKKRCIKCGSCFKVCHFNAVVRG
ncbi:MAG: NADH-quinone oxidoreductase subunit NuoF [Coxiellaceae bacterium]|jgi:NADH:ubiquinone oxidoreductase subunit F (NADH-binding)/(2Fe-2S) ferredoxin/NAD-dependent dihydropyrimidine dehydrogenase PreA subunit|nr:NADH-quinone oxidoreductase subunit NuoF [Coxiellaceae bacterium]